MQFTCLQENLIKGLSAVSKAVPTKASLPILSNILITTDSGKLKLSSTNLETAITTSVGASIDEEGSITIPAKLLHEFVSHLSPGTISGVVKDNILHLKTSGTKSRFNGINSDEYPELPVMLEEASYLELEPKTFSSAISAVAFSAANDESRPILTGVLLTYADGTLTVAASDGFRLSEKSVKIENGNSDNFSIVVPAKVLLEISRLFNSSTDPIKLVINDADNLALFAAEDTFIAARIIDGAYPDYKKIIPTDSAITATFSAAALLEAVKLANVFAKDSTSVVKLLFDPKGVIEVTSSSKETGENKSEFEASIEGDITEMAFSSKYLLDFLNNIKSEEILFGTNGNVAPGILRSDDHKDYLHIVMPVRVKG